MYKSNNYNINVIKIDYIINMLKYINNTYYLDNSRLESYTFNEIYNDMCLYYNKNISLFKLCYIKCKEKNQKIFTQFIDKNL
jgi:hypothetical protein